MEELIKELENWAHYSDAGKTVELDVAKTILERAYNLGYEQGQDTLTRILEQLTK